MSTTTKPAVAAEPEVYITRTINAPRERVFDAWLDPAQLSQWYAPQGCGIRFENLDARKNGRFHSCITTPDGKECWCAGHYIAIEPPTRLVFEMHIANSTGDAIDWREAGMAHEWPQRTTVTVEFKDLGRKTELTLHQTVSEALAKQTGAHPSWLQMLDRLEALVA